MTHTPNTITYSHVVTRETFCTDLPMVALHDLEVKATDVLSANMTASNSKKIWTVLGPEFGDDTGKSAIIFRVLNGLKSASASFRAHLAQYVGIGVSVL